MVNFIFLWHITFFTLWILDLDSVSFLGELKKYVMSLLLFIGIPLSIFKLSKLVLLIGVAALFVSSYLCFAFVEGGPNSLVFLALLSNFGAFFFLVYNYLYEFNESNVS